MPRVAEGPGGVHGSGRKSFKTLSGNEELYDYPEGLDLRPGSPLHAKVVSEVMMRARASHEHVGNKHELWKKIDKTLTAYIAPDEEELGLLNSDERKPVSIVVPTSYAARETFLTYLSATFLQDPIFRLSHVGPEDAIGAKLLEIDLQQQNVRFKNSLPLYTHWSDGISYGVGAVTSAWSKQTRPSVVMEEVIPEVAELLGVDLPEEMFRELPDEEVLFEGNKLQSIDSYNYLPDPNVSVVDVQDGNFVGWAWRTNLMNLLLEEEDPNRGRFNGKFVRDLHRGNGRSNIVDVKSGHARGTWSNDPDADGLYGTDPADIIRLYIKLIPREWELGSGEKPQTWMFEVAGDSVVIGCDRLREVHGQFPVGVCAPNMDGHEAVPVSLLMVTYGMQKLQDWLTNAHVANVRKAINDITIVDPSVVYWEDVIKPGPGKLIRIKTPHFGQGNLDAYMKQFPVQDVTKQHMADMGSIMQLQKDVLGTGGMMEGNATGLPERPTARGMQGLQTAGLSKMQKIAVLISLQSHQTIAYQMAYNTQQFRTQPESLAVVGRHAEDLKREYGLQQGQDRLRVDPAAMNIGFDIAPHDGSMPGMEPLDIWQGILQIVSQNAEVYGPDVAMRTLQHVARLAGAKNVQDFMPQGGEQEVNRQVEVQDDNKVENEVQAGNLVPFGGAA